MKNQQPILSVENLSTTFFSKEGAVKAVNDVSFSVKKGEILGLVGESGSGKSVTGFSILGLVDAPGKVTGGRIVFEGNDLTQYDEKQYRKIRGQSIAMIFQDPMMTLNPVLRIDTQMIEAIRAHEKVSKKAATARAIETLEMVGIPSAKERMRAYPHQFSGGMRQRVAFATALLNRPALIIADEPTTALDVTIQAQILYQTQKLCRETGTSLIWITHDLTVVAGLADKVCVMYAGKIVETGSVDQILDQPSHPYTQGLIASVPSHNKPGEPLAQIPGMTPSLLNIAPGCAFRSRCNHTSERCHIEPLPIDIADGHSVRCHHAQEGLSHV